MGWVDGGNEEKGLLVFGFYKQESLVGSLIFQLEFLYLFVL